MRRMTVALVVAFASAVLGLAAQSPTPFGIPTTDQPAPASAIPAVPGSRAQGWLAQGRSEVLARHGVVATSDPLAAQAGVEIMRRGGNAIDAAVAAGAVLDVTSQNDTGIGGDLFALVWSARDKKLYALASAGWAPAGWTPQFFTDRLRVKSVPSSGVNAATVPGAIAGYDALLKKFGTRGFKETFEPAARLAEEGWGLAERRHDDLRGAVKGLLADPDSRQTFLAGDAAPALYSIIRNPGLAKALRLIQQQGRDVFYRGEIADAIVKKVQANGGVMSREDLAEFQPEWVEPISTSYHGYDIFQLPPPGQGMAALEMLNILEVCVPKLGFNLTKLGPADPTYWHLLVEAKKLAYADLLAKNADPKFAAVPVKELLSKSYAATLCDRIKPDRASKPGVTGGTGGGTIYLTTADRWGNMVSLIHSVFSVYGSRATVRAVRVRAAQPRRRLLARSEQPEPRRAAQAPVPHDHRRLRDEGRPAADDVRQHGRQRPARNARAAHGQSDRPRDERADDHRRGAVHAQPDEQRPVARDQPVQPGRRRAQGEGPRGARGRRRRGRRLPGHPLHARSEPAAAGHRPAQHRRGSPGERRLPRRLRPSEGWTSSGVVTST